VLLHLFRCILRAPGLWAGAIRAFEREPVQRDAVVFIGSSSLRFWTTLAADLAPLPALNRGFGGATIVGVNLYAPRILARTPDPRAIVLYAGVNDLAWGASVDEVFAEIQRFVALAGRLAPDAPVYVLSAQLTPRRRTSWIQVRELNARLAGLVGVRYVDVASVVLDRNGRPRRELFRFDGIHMKPSGYALWTQLLRPRLLEDLSRR
jgi:lysophospholipase L1-like esterase